MMLNAKILYCISYNKKKVEFHYCYVACIPGLLDQFKELLGIICFFSLKHKIYRSYMHL